VCGHGDTNRLVTPRDFLHGDRVCQGVCADPTIFLRDWKAHKAKFSQLPDYVIGKFLELVVVLGPGGNLVLGEVVSEVSNALLFVG
jgi:hypothetical protein